jgi:hypothetical protein
MLNTFQTFLQDKKAIKPQYVPFYLKWVSDCYGFLNEPLSTRLAIEESRAFGPNQILSSQLSFPLRHHPSGLPRLRASRCKIFVSLVPDLG